MSTRFNLKLSCRWIYVAITVSFSSWFSLGQSNYWQGKVWLPIPTREKKSPLLKLKAQYLYIWVIEGGLSLIHTSQVNIKCCWTRRGPKYLLCGWLKIVQMFYASMFGGKSVRQDCLLKLAHHYQWFELYLLFIRFFTCWRKNKSFLKDNIFKEPETVIDALQILVILIIMIIQRKSSMTKYFKMLF